MADQSLSLKTTLRLVDEDCKRLNSVTNRLENTARPLTWRRRASLVLRPEIMAMAFYRLSHYFHRKGWSTLANLFYMMNTTLSGCTIDPASEIGPGCLIVHPVGCAIRARVGKNATFFARNIVVPYGESTALPVLGDNVTISAMVTILGPVTIADRVAIMPFSLIEETIEDEGWVVRRLPGKPLERVIRRETDILGGDGS